MKFIPASDDILGELSHRQVSQNNLVEMGVYRVLFGWRIRSGFCGNFTYALDWCCGNDWKNVEILYSICLGVLSNREEDRHCFDGLPSFSKTKPFFLDLEFLEIVTKQAGNFSHVTLDPTKQITHSTKMLNRLFSQID